MSSPNADVTGLFAAILDGRLDAGADPALRDRDGRTAVELLAGTPPAGDPS